MTGNELKTQARPDGACGVREFQCDLLKNQTKTKTTKKEVHELLNGTVT